LPDPRINGGTVRSSAAFPFIALNGAKFQDVTVEGSLVSRGLLARGLSIATNGRILVPQQLSIGHGNIPNDDQTVTGQGAIELQGGTLTQYNAAVTLDSGLTVTGSGAISLGNGFTNRGTILAEPGGSIAMTWFNTAFSNATGHLIARGNGVIALCKGVHHRC